MHGVLSSINENTATVVYTPDPGFAEEDSFSFKIGNQVTSLHTVTIKVQDQPTLLTSQQAARVNNIDDRHDSNDHNTDHGGHNKVKLAHASNTPGGRLFSPAFAPPSHDHNDN